MPVNNGDTLIIPAPTDANKNGHRVTVKWQQLFSNKTADYYALVAKNKTQGGADVPFFVEAEWYTDGYLAGAGSRIDEGHFEIKVDNRLQYGQKNAAGEMRFIVYHDKARKPYQHRFLETALGSLAADVVGKLAVAFGYVPIPEVALAAKAAETAKTLLQGFVGDYLRDF